MGRESRQISGRTVWRLAERQQGVITRRQLFAAGFSSDEVDSRIVAGRLHRIWRGVYSVGRPRLTPRGWWTGAVLACGADSALSHTSAAALWGILAMKTEHTEAGRPPTIHVSLPSGGTRVRVGICVHRSTRLPAEDRAHRDAIPVTTPGRTLLDLATLSTPEKLERAVNDADKLGLIDPETLRGFVAERAHVDGVTALRAVLDRRTFQLTDSELERRFLRLVRRAGLPPPLTQQRVNGFRVDFFWPELGLVVETDGLRYHRTPAQQSRDRERDQAHVAAGLTILRFTQAQVRFEGTKVASTLRAVAERCRTSFVGLPGP